jgi:hypothetical protein
VDIVITRNIFYILVDFVIADPIRTNLVQHVSTITMHATTIATQNKA